MRAGFEIKKPALNIRWKFIIVSNYDGLNRISHWSCVNVDDLKISRHDIGVWKIKHLKN